jgi:hypothetical protein
MVKVFVNRATKIIPKFSSPHLSLYPQGRLSLSFF